MISNLLQMGSQVGNKCPISLSRHCTSQRFKRNRIRRNVVTWQVGWKSESTRSFSSYMKSGKYDVTGQDVNLITQNKVIKEPRTWIWFGLMVVWRQTQEYFTPEKEKNLCHLSFLWSLWNFWKFLEILETVLPLYSILLDNANFHKYMFGTCTVFL